MNTNAKLVMLLAAGTLVLGSALPALAASAVTERFVASAHPTVDFLDGSSRLAMTASTSPKLRAYARTQAAEQTAADDALSAWTQGRPGQVAVLDTDAVMTGRSVAIDGAVPIVAARTPAPGTLLPSGQGVMDRLARLKGRGFDALYRSAQRDALERLAALYSDYAANGDDPDLRALATRELPKVDRRLAALRAL